MMTTLRYLVLAVLLATLLAACSTRTPVAESDSSQVLDESWRDLPRRLRGGRDGIPPGPLPPEPPGYAQIKITSTADGAEQDAVLVVPQRELAEPRSLVIYLHGWSVDFTDRRPDLEADAEKRGWLLLQPNFRGRYVNHCGNELAQQDILDAANWAKQNYGIDPHHVYLVGFSGGGFLSLIMAYKYPQEFAAISAWSGFGDLLENYAELMAADPENRYAREMRSCFGGDPLVSPEVADRFREREPINYLVAGMELPPLDLNSQKEDPLVNPQRILRVFQKLAPQMITNEEIAVFQRAVDYPSESFVRIDPATGREVYFRRTVDDLQVTIRAGNHEMLSAAAFEWFDQFSRR